MAAISDWSAWLRAPDEDRMAASLRMHTGTERPLGSTTFLDALETLLDRTVRPRKGGRPGKRRKRAGKVQKYGPRPPVWCYARGFERKVAYWAGICYSVKGALEMDWPSTVARVGRNVPGGPGVQPEENESHGEEKNMASGTVKWFNDEKGYGFITPDDGGNDLFIHHSNIQMTGFKTLKDGQRVQYEAAQGKKGPEATNVTAL
jgi:CspA family cold shock protein